jgi:GntR family transcriptional regulator
MDPIFSHIQPDHSSAIPLYSQVKHALVELMAANVLPPGYQLPSEEDLAASSGISRATVRQALAELAREGRVEKIHGKGTFVSDYKVPLTIGYRLISFLEDMAQSGHRVTTRILELMEGIPPIEVAQMLKIPPSAHATLFMRLRLLDGQPFMIDTIHISADLCPGLEHADLENRGLFQVIETDYGLRIARAQRTLRVVPAESWAAVYLRLSKNDPLHLLTDLAFTSSGKPILYAHTLVHGGRSEFRFELVAENDKDKPAVPSMQPVNPQTRMNPL